jgi:hypothetical protein
MSEATPFVRRDRLDAARTGLIDVLHRRGLTIPVSLWFTHHNHPMRLRLGSLDIETVEAITRALDTEPRFDPSPYVV